jgi:hypothetical protein
MVDRSATVMDVSHRRMAMTTLAQTSQIEREIEAKLWLLWAWDRVTTFAESPSGLFVLVVVVVAILLTWRVWLRRPRVRPNR